MGWTVMQSACSLVSRWELPLPYRDEVWQQPGFQAGVTATVSLRAST